MNLKDFMEVTQYRITEGNEYSWECYGPNAYILDSWDGDFDGNSISVTFDTKTQVVFQMEAYDYRNNKAYRWINPDFVTAHDAEACAKGIDDRQAWEEVMFTELGEAEFLVTARDIVDDRI